MGLEDQKFHTTHSYYLISRELRVEDPLFEPKKMEMFISMEMEEMEIDTTNCWINLAAYNNNNKFHLSQNLLSVQHPLVQQLVENLTNVDKLV